MRTRDAKAAGDVVLLVGTYRPAVSAARALARRGFRVIAGLSDERQTIEGSGGVHRSRAVSAVWRHPALSDDPTPFLASVREEIGRHAGPVYVLPFYQPVVVQLSEHRDSLPPNAVLVAPSPEVVRQCVDKDQCLAIAAAAGLPVLPWRIVTSQRELRDVTAELRRVAIRPLWPRTRLNGHKALLCHDPQALERQLPTWPGHHERLLVQRLASGPRLNMHFAAQDGRLIGVVEAVALRTDTPDGTGLTTEARTRRASAGVVEQLTTLTRRLGYSGVGLAQFLMDGASNDAYLIELNPRMGSVHVIAERAGLDLANLAVDVAAGRTVTPVTTSARPVRSAWTTGDIVGLARCARTRQLGRRAAAIWLRDLVVGAIRADVHATWSWRDPGPAVATVWRALMLGISR